jgi:hypothetical protein
MKITANTIEIFLVLTSLSMITVLACTTHLSSVIVFAVPSGSQQKVFCSIIWRPRSSTSTN